ncbi:hypothetical protein Caci_2994 [Catenulispora acidiphila DSM 44928]|uniref:Uncharacterized protein n=1 Tax=Catenulispora acidiphila (strain DSM 44928 / JCM 14897 / NBRC 102108 / NRRL B-24433 / ID139908) TaxID=479433 RepID=C7Q311_CATAD|nr:hypothetical protein [Catenulispora acidiphila]ACU71903.1 hypothetical protein Caci_2994 [Catenulispora acidiphila DSM 44928]
MTDTTTPTAAEQAAAHLIEKLERMANNSVSLATYFENAAKATRSREWISKHKESAEFHRAFASQVDEVLYRLITQAGGYPGIPGDGWRDNEGDVWVLCADNMLRLLDDETTSRDPDDLAGEYGPMEPVGSES